MGLISRVSSRTYRYLVGISFEMHNNYNQNPDSGQNQGYGNMNQNFQRMGLNPNAQGFNPNANQFVPGQQFNGYQQQQQGYRNYNPYAQQGYHNQQQYSQQYNPYQQQGYQNYNQPEQVKPHQPSPHKNPTPPKQEPVDDGEDWDDEPAPQTKPKEIKQETKPQEPQPKKEAPKKEVPKKEEPKEKEQPEQKSNLSKIKVIKADKLPENMRKYAKEHLNVVFIGHVDAGKSTIGGQIMKVTGMVDQRTLEKFEREAKEKNRESWYLSWALDTNLEERDKGKTVECGRAFFETENKHFSILDAPGHKSFVPN